jgi:hypothetical protein
VTVPFKPEVTAPWLTKWLQAQTADATRVAPQTPQLPPVPVIGPAAAKPQPGVQAALDAENSGRVKLGRGLQAAQVAAEFLPGIAGDVASAGAAVREARKGNAGMAALSAAAALPFVPVSVKAAKNRGLSSKQVMEIRNAAKGGGFTFDPRSGSFVQSGGYMVGGVPGQKGIAVETLTPKVLNEFVEKNSDLLSRDGMMFGGWFDEDSGKYFLDVSERVPDRDEALKLLKERGEKSAWHLDEGAELRNSDVTEAVSAGSAPVVHDAPVAMTVNGWDELPEAEREALDVWEQAHGGEFNPLPKDTPLEAPTIKAGGEGPALDESNLKLVPDYVTDPMERAPTYRAPRADLSMLTPMWKRVSDIFAKNADAGLREGLGAWYDVSPLRQAFKDESPTGQEDFELLMKLLGPTSSGTKTPQNVKQASLMYFLNKQDPVKFLDDLREGTLDIPKGYANRRQSSVNRGVRRILEEGDLSYADQPKTFRYGNIPTGRFFHSVPLDMHVGRQTGRAGYVVGEKGDLTPGRGFPMPSFAKDKKVGTSPHKPAYAPIEDRILAEAEKRGVPGAPFMAAGWVKGGMPDAIGGSTGVGDLRGLIPLFNERIALTAKQRGVSQSEALKGFINGQWPLAAIGGVAAGRGLLADSE